MNGYCTQSKFGYFGARWACAVTTLVIILEHIRRTVLMVPDWRVTQDEIDRIGGRFLRLGNENIQPPCYVSNYKDHRDVFDGDKVDDGWSSAADPEPHWFIRSWKWTLAEIADAMGVPWEQVQRVGRRYGILVVDVDGNPYDGKVSTHFEPLHSGKVIANPDPRLAGFPEVERRPLPV